MKKEEKMGRGLLKFLGICLLLGAIAVIVGGATEPSPPPSKNIKPFPDMILGNPKAPLTIIEYTSFTCAHCAEFHEKTLPLLKQNYLDKGEVKIIFREYPSDGLALRATAVARCVKPALYFKVVEALFQKQNQWIFAKDYVGELWKSVRQFGLKRDQVNACVANDLIMDQIVAGRMAYMKEHKINQTPTFIINGQVYSYFLSFESLDKILRPLVAAHKKKGREKGKRE
jgi:protein-disulfide isomerase